MREQFKRMFMVSFIFLSYACDDAGKVQSRCGDNHLDPEEECDGADLGGNSCESLGYYNVSGVLGCTAMCEFDISDCGELVGRVADHTVVPQFELLPQDALVTVVNNLNVYFGHTSHGSQLITGMGMLDPLFDHSQMNLTEEYGDLGTEGDLAWEGLTRSHLGAHPETNVVIWSWCGGQSTNTVDGVQIYLNAMNQLEEEFPDVAFIYMTGHLDGTGDDGLLRENNRQIRDWCLQNGKLLFDFEDIESWDPAGEYYPDGTDACEWCSDWMMENPEACPDCADSCAHSHCFNCYQKGKAFWWLLARIAGWNGVGGA